MFFSLAYRIQLDPWVVKIMMIYKQTVELKKQKSAEKLSSNNCRKKAMTAPSQCLWYRHFGTGKKD